MTQMLKPNEKAEYQKGADKIKVFDVNTEYDTAWKNGEIIFRNHPMDKVLKTLERHYHVVFEVKDNEILQVHNNSPFQGRAIASGIGIPEIGVGNPVMRYINLPLRTVDREPQSWKYQNEK